MIPKDDQKYLLDILDSARAIFQFAGKMNLEQFTENKMARRAVERELEIIGEATRNLSEEFRLAHKEIPWKAIIAQRNILAHDYGAVLVNKIHLVVINRIPELIRLLEPFVRKEEP